MSIHNVDHSWAITCWLIIITTTAESVTSTDINDIIALGDVFGFNLEASSIMNNSLFVSIGDHFVTGENINPDSHVYFCIYKLIY
jgi:hypothetical protein